MADSNSNIHLDHLFIAVPELTFNLKFVEIMRERGYISERQYEQIIQGRRVARKAGRAMDALRGGSLINRLLAVSGELITIETVDMLRFAGLIDATQGHALRIAVRTLNAATRGGLPSDRAQVFSRLSRILGAQISFERIDLWASMGLITAEEADRWRGYLRSGTVIQESLAKAKRAKNLLDALMLLGEIPVSRQMVSGMVQAGIISPRFGRVYNSVITLGQKQWKVFRGAKAAEGYRARLLLVLTGSMNAELLDFLVTNKFITRSQWVNMQILEIAARNVNDRLLEDLIKRRFRVLPNEAPIKTFARASRVNEGDILRLLADAARESSKEAAALAASGKFGNGVRSRQYRLQAAALHDAMRNMWEGVGYLAIRGEREVAEAAAESALKMQQTLLKGRFSPIHDALLWQAKAGVDSYISREENTLNLSRRVYKNIALYEGKVDQRIALSLLQGRSPQEIATDIRRFITPQVPGGVSYAALRLARTEINNAFHLSTIRYTRESPWVRGYKWNLSGSHGRPDVCNQMAGDDHAGLGPGVYRKANVPAKPHPQCLCYITTVQMSPDEFVTAYRAGRFESFMRLTEQGNSYGDNFDSASLGDYTIRGLNNLRTEVASNFAAR